MNVLRWAGVALGVVVAATCDGRETSTPPPGVGTLMLQVVAADTVISSVRVTVSASDLDQPFLLALRLDSLSRRATGEITIAAGPSRQIHATAFGSLGDSLYEADDTVDVVPGTNPALALLLVPLPGGSVDPAASVELFPAAAALPLGRSGVPFTAVVRSRSGAPVVGPSLAWGSDDPSVAVVGRGGTVTALRPGRAVIAASAQTVFGLAPLIVIARDTAAGTTLATVSACDDCAEVVTLPFSFPFFGHLWGSLYVASNGVVSFGAAYTSYIGTGPEVTGPPRIAAYLADLIPASGSDVRVHTTPTYVSVQWRGLGVRGDTATVRAALQLWADGHVVLTIDPSAAPLPSAILGILPGAAGSGATWVRLGQILDGAFTGAPGFGLWEQPTPFDLAGRALVFVPTTDGRYIVTGCQAP